MLGQGAEIDGSDIIKHYQIKVYNQSVCTVEFTTSTLTPSDLKNLNIFRL